MLELWNCLSKINLNKEVNTIDPMKTLSTGQINKSLQRNAVVINAHESLSKRLSNIDQKIDNIALHLKNVKHKPKGNITVHKTNNNIPDLKQSVENYEIKHQKPYTKSTLIDTKVGRRVLFGSGFCALCFNLANEKSKNTNKSNYWDYEAAYGPAFWHKNEVCVPTSSQSPINIIKADCTEMQYMPQIKFDYGDGDRNSTCVINTGHGTMQVNFEEGKYTTTVDGRTLNLVQFHFHTPSEHAIDGQHSAMEVHLVHQDVDTGQLNVFGSLMDGSGQPNAALQACLEEAPHAKDIVAPITVDPNTLLPPLSKRTYFNYSGSLTTPPCSEDVNWYVFEHNIQCSPRQVIAFQNYLQNGNSLSMNARPIQPLKNRTIMIGKIN